jgi:hypothetical protein
VNRFGIWRSSPVHDVFADSLTFLLRLRQGPEAAGIRQFRDIPRIALTDTKL